jgi:hypothetical protein
MVVPGTAGRAGARPQPPDRTMMALMPVFETALAWQRMGRCLQATGYVTKGGIESCLQTGFRPC